MGTQEPIRAKRQVGRLGQTLCLFCQRRFRTSATILSLVFRESAISFNVTKNDLNATVKCSRPGY